MGCDAGLRDREQGQGAAKEMIGTVREKAGGVVGNEEMKAEGAAQKIEGKVQCKVGEAEALLDT